MYKDVLNYVVKISIMFAKYFEYYTIILRGTVFLWTCCILSDVLEHINYYYFYYCLHRAAITALYC